MLKKVRRNRNWFSKYEEIINGYNEELKKYSYYTRILKDKIHGKEVLDTVFDFTVFIDNIKSEIKELDVFEVTKITFNNEKLSNVFIEMEHTNKKEIKINIDITPGTRTTPDGKLDIYYVMYDGVIIFNEKSKNIKNKLKNYLIKEIEHSLINIALYKENVTVNFDSSYGKYEIFDIKNKGQYDDLLGGYIPYNDKGVSNSELNQGLKLLKGFLKSDKRLLSFLEDKECNYRSEEVKYEWKEYKLF